ncbi:cysteine desulfurase family protein [Kocuria rhizophila]|uniref:cysteine desulfurase family protein n=1 Tax=Kocuria rhizophila TaxID=72000 RepID=UPI000F525B1B|nr:cysteine desulfurase family protein [Kocuria rhizophila]MCT1917576.1 cysteine desulfurase [Kocuria rhizophila]
MIYLDHAATAAPRRDVLEAMWPWLTSEFGNASSHHERGRRAAHALEHARERVAAVLHARPGEIVFTSGGTEADNLAVKGIALARRERRPSRTRVVTSAIEHHAVLDSAADLARYDGFTHRTVPVDPSGVVTPEAFRAALLADDAARPGSQRTAPGAGGRAGGVVHSGESEAPEAAPSTATTGGEAPEGGAEVAVASVMLANNEVGTVQDLAALAEIAAEHGVPLHTDAVQAAGVLPLDVRALGVSALSLAGHKIGTPPGIGLLWIARGTPLRPLLSGGGHERGRRSGTSTVAGAVGLAVALERAEAEREEHVRRTAALRDRLIAGILGRVPGVLLTGPDPRAGGNRLAPNASFCFPGVNGETVLVDLENRGVQVSSGSACSAGSTEPSHVLTALGLSPGVASTAVRFSLGRDTTAQDVDAAIAATADVVTTLLGRG